MQRINQLPDDDAYCFSAVFSANKSVVQKLRRKFMDYLKSAETAVGNATATGTYQMSFDLFAWTESGD